MYPVTAKGARERRGEMPGREREKGKERGCNGHRGRDVDDRKTKIRNSNLSREQLISRTHLPPSSLRPCPPRCSRLADHPSHCLSAPRWRRKPPLSSSSATPHTDAARLTFLRPEIPTVIGRQTVRLTVATEWRN